MDKRFSKEITFVRLNSREIFSSGKKKTIELFTTNAKWRMSSHGLITSTPERAMLEVLFDVPGKVSFDHANELMQGMTTFVPQVVQSMLEQCNNVKCKRLFLLLAERNHHQWIPQNTRYSNAIFFVQHSSLHQAFYFPHLTRFCSC